MSSLRTTLWVSGLVIFASTSVVAQTARTGGTANAQLLEQLQQLGSERTTLQAENARLQKDLDATRKDRDALKKAQQVADTRAKESSTALARAAADKNASQDEVQRLKGQMQELITKFRETAETLRTVEVEDNTTKQTLATRDRDLQVCVGHNQALYKLNDEVLTRLEHPSLLSRAASVEPFTRLERVRLENLVDDYKGRADDQHMKPVAPAPAVTPGQTGAPAPAPAQTPAGTTAAIPGGSAPPPRSAGMPAPAATPIGTPAPRASATAHPSATAAPNGASSDSAPTDAAPAAAPTRRP